MCIYDIYIYTYVICFLTTKNATFSDFPTRTFAPLARSGVCEAQVCPFDFSDSSDMLERPTFLSLDIQGHLVRIGMN